jgi:hypothetical protein
MELTYCILNIKGDKGLLLIRKVTRNEFSRERSHEENLERDKSVALLWFILFNPFSDSGEETRNKVKSYEIINRVPFTS